MSLEHLRIGYISDERFPSRWTDTQQIMKTAAALAAEGADVEVILPRKADVWFASSDRRRAVLEQYYGIEARFTLTQLRTVPASRLRIEKLTHGLAAPLYSALRRHDVVYTRNVLPLLVALAAGRPAVFESHRRLQRHYPLVARAIRAVRKHPCFLGVVTNAAVIASAFRDLGFPPDRLIVAHNSFDPHDFEPRLDKEEARRRLNLPLESRLVCYAGHIKRFKGIDTIVALANRTPELQYLICGGFPEDIQQAQSLAAAAGVKNLRFTGWIDVSKLSPYLYAADVLLIPPSKAPFEEFGRTVLPIKAYGYLATGRVIVAPRLPDVAEVLKDGENALLATPDDLDDAARIVRRAFSEPELASRLAAQAVRDSARYTWQSRARELLGFIGDQLANFQQRGKYTEKGRPPGLRRPPTSRDP